jgi:hypothetical protein
MIIKSFVAVGLDMIVIFFYTLYGPEIHVKNNFSQGFIKNL